MVRKISRDRIVHGTARSSNARSSDSISALDVASERISSMTSSSADVSIAQRPPPLFRTTNRTRLRARDIEQIAQNLALDPLNAGKRGVMRAGRAADRIHRRRSSVVCRGIESVAGCSPSGRLAVEVCRADASRAMNPRIAPKRPDRSTAHKAQTIASGTMEESISGWTARGWRPCGKNCYCKSPGNPPAATSRNREHDRARLERRVPTAPNGLEFLKHRQYRVGFVRRNE